MHSNIPNRALTIQQKAVGNKHPELAYTYEILGNVYKNEKSIRLVEELSKSTSTTLATKGVKRSKRHC